VLEDVFEMQEEVTRAIVAAMVPQIDSIEETKARLRRPDNLTDYEMGLRAWTCVWEAHDKADRTLFIKATQLAKKALAVDPNNVLATHALAFSRGLSFFLGFADDPEAALHEAMFMAAKGVELDNDNAFGYALRGFCAYLSL